MKVCVRCGATGHGTGLWRWDGDDRLCYTCWHKLAYKFELKSQKKQNVKWKQIRERIGEDDGETEMDE